ncbi:MAG TPA: hypothetical protein VGJ41_10660 [Nocardioides sp.]
MFGVGGEEVEGALGVGEDADRHRAAYVEGLRAAGGGERRGDPGQGGVEVVGVLEVGPDLDVDDPGVPGPVGVHADVAGVEAFELLELALLGMQPQHRLVDQPVEHHHADPMGDLDQVRVEVGGDVGGGAVGGLGDPPGPPGGQVAAEQPGPGPGQPVSELERVVDQPGAGVGGHPQRGRQGRGRVPGEVGQVAGAVMAAERAGRPGPVGARHHRVQVRPLGRGDQDRHLGRVGGPPQLADPREDDAGSVELPGLRLERCDGHVPILSKIRSKQQPLQHLWISPTIRVRRSRVDDPGRPASRS